MKRQNKEPSGWGKSNRALMSACIVSVTFMLLVTAGSMVYFKSQLNKSTRILEETEYEAYEKYYVLIPQDNASAFWNAVYESAREAGKAHGIYVEMLGSNLSTGYSPADRMKMAVEAGVDGIIVEADESVRMKQAIDEAEEKSIPVVTVLGDSKQSLRKSFVGISSYNLGREYGKQVLEAVAGRETKHVLVLMNANAADTSQNILYSGIQEAVEEAEGTGEGSAIRLQAAAVDSQGPFAVEESIRNIFMDKEHQPDVIICLDELSTRCTYQAVVDYNKVGVIDIIGYYDSETILRAIERNVIRSTISINTEEMGRSSVEALEEYQATGYVSEYFLVGANVITAENVEEYMGGREDEVE